MIEAALHDDTSLDARIDALARVVAMLDLTFLRERDERVCSEIVLVVDRLLAMVARAPGAIDVAIGEALDRLDARDGAAIFGHSGIPDYSREELDIAGSSAEKMSRLSRELRTRPLLQAAVREGSVTAREAEAILPVAKGEDEALWVDRARKESLRSLKQAVKAPGPVEDDEESVAVFRAHVPSELRPLVDEAEELAGRVVGAASPRWHRTRAVCEEYLSTHPASRHAAVSFSGARDQSLEALKKLLEEETEHWASLGLPAAVRAPDALPDGADVFALDRELRRLAQQRRRCGEMLGFLAMLFQAMKGWHYVGFASFGHYCDERLGMAERTVAQRAALERKLYQLPVLREALRDRRISYEHARLLARSADAGSLEAWIARAEELTVIELRRELQGKEEAQMCARREYRVSLPRSVAGLLAATIQAVREAEGRWLPPGECYAKACAHFVEVWKPLLATRNTLSGRVLRRDRGLCQVPVCSRAAAHAHHMVFRSAGGSDDEANLTSLCAAHHLRGVHMGRVRVSAVPPDRLRWELGVSSGRAPRRVFVRPAPALRSDARG